MTKKVSACPISKNKVDERVARMNGLVSLIFVVSGIYLPVLWIVIAVDFFVRSINPKVSIITKFNKAILSSFKGKPILIDAAPKIFAARMGLTMSILLIIFNYYQVANLTNLVLVFFITAMLLEVIFKYCIGCKIYSILIGLGLIKVRK